MRRREDGEERKQETRQANSLMPQAQDLASFSSFVALSVQLSKIRYKL